MHRVITKNILEQIWETFKDNKPLDNPFKSGNFESNLVIVNYKNQIGSKLNLENGTTIQVIKNPVHPKSLRLRVPFWNCVRKRKWSQKSRPLLTRTNGNFDRKLTDWNTKTHFFWQWTIIKHKVISLEKSSSR